MDAVRRLVAPGIMTGTVMETTIETIVPPV